MEGVGPMTEDKIHARDCEACETERGRVDWIEREIADNYPVHRTLLTEAVVNTKLKA